MCIGIHAIRIVLNIYKKVVLGAVVFIRRLCGARSARPVHSDQSGDRPSGEYIIVFSHLNLWS